jgi:uncharacterized protein YndB with AHSA1/START domain
MTVLNTIKDPDTLTMTMVTQFEASPDRVWGVWEDPRKLERWWGPPTYPATFTRHDFVVGGQSRFHMTGPNGEIPRGWWRIDALDYPHAIQFANGLAGDDGEPAAGIEPMAGEVIFADLDGGTQMTVITRFTDLEQMEKMLAMGMQEGMVGALSQIDALLVPVAA